MTDLLTPDDFKPHLDKAFRVRDSHHEFTLAKVEEHPVRPEDAPLVKRTPFTLIFRGPPGDVLAEGMRTLEVAGETASYEVYLMPIHTPWPDRQDYQAALN